MAVRHGHRLPKHVGGGGRNRAELERQLGLTIVKVSGTGQTNLFKYVAGLNPLDPTSRFTFSIASVPGQAWQRSLSFNPVVSGRTYSITARSNLMTGSWTPINGSAPSDNGATRTIIDLGASGTTKFYHVDITKP
ncbi:MAG: hypothetical protein ABIR71_08635 [Chthoniobacterales bacterium]